MQYKPSAEAKVLTQAVLTDAEGKPISGIDYYSNSATGITDEKGGFEFLWGDEISFGIDTFSFGQVKGNQVQFALSDVSENPLIQANIESIIQRYGIQQNGHWQIPERVKEIFQQHPNTINEIIKLSLPNGGALEGSSFTLPNEFEAQFTKGLAKDIDAQLAQPKMRTVPTSFRSAMAPNLTQTLQNLFKGVQQFHIFNDNKGLLQRVGLFPCDANVNLSNRAFPILMPRVDVNHWLDFGQPQAWTREGKPYIAVGNTPDATPPIPNIDKNNAVFGMPFVTSGEIGAGKIVYMGNSLYPSILSCLNFYWADGDLRLDAEGKTCSAAKDLTGDPRDDQGSMKQFFSNLFTWMTPNYAAGNMQVATNIKKAWLRERIIKMGFNMIISSIQTWALAMFRWWIPVSTRRSIQQ